MCNVYKISKYEGANAKVKIMGKNGQCNLRSRSPMFKVVKTNKSYQNHTK